MSNTKKTKYKIRLSSWFPNKKHGNPHFWSFSVLPEFQIMHSDANEPPDFYFGWLFWTIEISKEYTHE